MQGNFCWIFLKPRKISWLWINSQTGRTSDYQNLTCNSTLRTKNLWTLRTNYGEPIFEYFKEIKQPIFTHYNFLPAYIDSYRIVFFLNQEPSVPLQVRQETVINNTVHLSTFPINILYDSAACHEIQSCIQTASQYSHLNFITQCPATAQAVEPTTNFEKTSTRYLLFICFWIEFDLKLCFFTDYTTLPDKTILFYASTQTETSHEKVIFEKNHPAYNIILNFKENSTDEFLDGEFELINTNI